MGAVNLAAGGLSEREDQGTLMTSRARMKYECVISQCVQPGPDVMSLSADGHTLHRLDEAQCTAMVTRVDRYRSFECSEKSREVPSGLYEA